MIRVFSFTYSDCAECSDKDDCVQCGSLLEEMLMRLDCVSGVDVDMDAGRICVETDGSDEDALTETFENAGILVDSFLIRPE